jgi:hypothetical protein
MNFLANGKLGLKVFGIKISFLRKPCQGITP